MRHKIEVDRDVYTASATCYTIDPASFESNSEGESKVLGGTSKGRSAGSFGDDKMTGTETATNSRLVSVLRIGET